MLLVYITSSSSAQTWQWGKRGGGNIQAVNPLTQNESIKDIALDKYGNSYFVATIRSDNNTVTVSDGGSVQGYGYLDIMVGSYSCSGAIRWKKVIGGLGWDGFHTYNLSIGIDTLGHVYVTGTTDQSPSTPVRFDTDTVLNTNNPKSVFLVQYDTSGIFKWLRMPAPDTVTYLRSGYYPFFGQWVNKDGTIDVFSFLQKSGPLGNSNGSVYIDSSAAYIISYDTAGNIKRLLSPDLKMRVEPGDSFTRFTDLGISRMPNGNYILSGTMDFGAPADTDKKPFYIGGQQIYSGMFVACFDSAWKKKWLRQGNPIPSGMAYNGGFVGNPAVDEFNNVYLSGFAQVGGQFNGYTFTNSFVPTSVPFVVKLDSNANTVWIKQALVSASTGVGPLTYTNGKVITTGTFPSSQVIWDGHSIGSNVMNVGYDIYLTKFDAQTGAVLGMDTVKSSPGYNEYLYAAASDQRGNVYLGGSMELNINVNSTNTISKNGGLTDFFLLKYGSSDCSSSVVPLSLTEFSASLESNRRDVVCRWQTENEVNTSRFIIERSADGVEFSYVGTVNAAGNSSSVQTYGFTDYSPFSSRTVLYYRLRLEDKDGSFTYSKVVRVQLPIEKDIVSTYPNPVVREVNVRFTSVENTKLQVSVMDMQGRMVATQSQQLNIGENIFTLNAAQLQSGTYIIKAVTASGEQVTTRFVKQ